MMPHRVLYLGYLKLTVGGAGAIGFAGILGQIDPDHVKALIVAIGMAFLALAYFGLKDLTPLYVSARKQLKQMQLDLDAMGSSVQENAMLIAVLNEKVAQAQREAARLDEENVILRDHLFQMLTHHKASLDSDVSAIGEVVLIQTGDMIDSAKGKGK